MREMRGPVLPSALYSMTSSSTGIPANRAKTTWHERPKTNDAMSWVRIQVIAQVAAVAAHSGGGGA
ncbi:hypothetical protein [Paraburkholderia sp. J41]|uniref:hypothetical protein n=1 Tax=Paraburkholderia sp. J41 TaxID=2805433 RepID=UPI002AC332CF|nr:hypothetical protein [Paraburkholderia sp. J41]